MAAIGLGDAESARQFRDASRITFPLLVDAERRAYRAARLASAGLLDLFRRENRAARSRASSAGHRQGRLGEHPFQLGGSFVLGPGNVDRFTHVSTTFGDTAPLESVLAALDNLSPRAP